MKITTKVLIIGSGPAGLSAAIYTARSALKPILINGMQPGGQLTMTTDVENYPGFAETIQGPWLMEQMSMQAKNVGTEIISDYVERVDLSKRPFKIFTGTGNEYEADSIIICTGAESKWLGIASEQEFRGFGVSSCAICDGFFFKNQEIVVVGGGNSALEEALYLTNHANKVTVVHRRNSFRAEKILQDRLFKNPKISVIWDHIIDEIVGSNKPKAVTGVKIQNVYTNEINLVNCSGVFIAIGHAPNTALFKGQIAIDDDNYIVTQSGSTRTNVEGVFAAGDVQDKIYRQAVTAAASGCMAALEVAKFLNK
ncbi:thioredoxin reductase [Rickettsia prowazekii str. GvV257]|uniref:Thioredoxin reductase n=1 Tax=Rickettsia prowazekii (strain Madrid E) TaxID=272947 RepID=TRXB_RICPR|nr:thioredoxin-disulfide reductase [Rickettsia prowazekii]Q9ZD97.1 RecName: Full=Thioredoxin reductase; Short=TRXR [Rickettsia prowazekii str. Madrid E]EOB09812.1 Thioredoxin reductase [Rickettsia prowazekii str. GvF12]AFE50104.1 thioredoxin reductase [Rickettsia prowazekii str. Katsinyian]AFE50949.1 thioredoxin reductase [Rickettsia prowazekii str. BuV67-CWPP]AFE52881.1 thioredoxin reductase [Rickettsia prowazekii str. GvV257]AFE53452.1 thioredoxin reductase [Rickettsia prowazekii str. RpGvF